MKKIFAFGAAAMALAMTSCSSEESLGDIISNLGKEKIQLAAGDDQNTVMTTRAGFTAQTRIVARIVSEKRDDSETKCVKTVLSAAAEADSKGYSVVSYNDGYTRYWDDAHGRYSRLSVYAVAIPNVNDASDNSNLKESVLSGGDTWSTSDTDKNSITWTVATTQTADLLNGEDLTYSNNIQKTGKEGVYTWDYTNSKYPEGAANASQHGTDPNTDGRLYFTQDGKTITDAITDAAGHFDKGQMEFNHALSRIQVNLIKDDGYEDATFNVTEMQVLGQSVSGTFDIKNANWTSKEAATPVNMAAITTKKGKAATYEAQVLPGYEFTETNIANTLQLTVDGNTYYIMNKQLYTALGENEKTTAMGKRYIFDVTVAKNKIQNITATVVKWNDVEAGSTTVDNSHLTFSFLSNGTNCTDINLYKFTEDLGQVYIDDSYDAKAKAGSAYTEVSGLEADGSTGKYKTSEFYNDNQTAYHFRSINNIAESALNAGKTAFTMTAGKADEAVNDYHWGAPMTSGLTALPYDATNGYLANIAKGIVAASTTSNINLTEIHMMSQLVIKLKTPATAAGVNLAGATVKLTSLSTTGSVDMGSGKITPSTPVEGMTAVAVEQEGENAVYSCTLNVIPQELKRKINDTQYEYVGITIHTADNNEYYIVKNLSEITGTAGSQITNMQTEGGKIQRWYPGHRYTYTFNITKTEIKNITATIAAWNDVNAGNTNLDLEK